MTNAKIITALSLALASPLVWGPAPPPTIPEPGLVPLLAVGAVVGAFMHWRSKRKK